MKKLITGITLIFALATFFTKSALADYQEAGKSGMPKFRQVNEDKFDYRVYTLRKFLAKFNSPLTPYSLDFIKTAEYYGIDYRIVPAISGVESTFGKQIPTNSYNAYGWAGGNYYFKSWTDSIKIVNKTLKENYFNKGANSIAKISRIYAPPSTTWGSKVQYFIGKIDILPLSFDI